MLPLRYVSVSGSFLSLSFALNLYGLYIFIKTKLLPSLAFNCVAPYQWFWICSFDSVRWHWYQAIALPTFASYITCTGSSLYRHFVLGHLFAQLTSIHMWAVRVCRFPRGKKLLQCIAVDERQYCNLHDTLQPLIQPKRGNIPFVSFHWNANEAEWKEDGLHRVAYVFSYETISCTTERNSIIIKYSNAI